MSRSAEFFFDLSSPWTRIAFANFRKAAAGSDIAITWRPAAAEPGPVRRP